MNAEIEKPIYHVLEFEKFDIKKRMPGTLCIFTDGCCSYWTGYWSPTDQKIYLDNYDGSRAELPLELAKYFSKLPNFISGE